MRERPKQPSYLDRHRSIEEHAPRSSANVGTKPKQPSNTNIKSTAVPIIPKKIDRSGDVTALRVRSGGAAKVLDKSPVGPNSGPGGGKMTQYKSLDDIPDGLPDSPHSRIVESRQNYDSKYSDEEDDADNDDEDSGSSYTVPNRNYSAGISSYSDPPSFPSEIASYGSNYGLNPGSYHVEVRDEKLSKYPPLQIDQETKQRPIVYQRSHMNSPSRHHQISTNEEEDWNDDDSEGGDSLPSHHSKSGKKSGYDVIDEDNDSINRYKRSSVTSTNNNAAPSRRLSANDMKHSNNSPHNHHELGPRVGTKVGQPPPGLPYEMIREDRDRETDRKAGLSESEKEKIPEKDQLYFSKQPRPVEYTPYTLGQYRQSNPKEYVEIVAHIKPDLNTEILKAKRANADRIKDFSKQLNNFNKINLSDQKKIPYSSEASGVEISRRKIESNRERAMQFAKQIPKPVNKLKVDGIGRVEEDGTGTGSGADLYLQSDEYGQSYEKATRLQELQAKHEDSRRNVQAIRKSMGM